MKEWLKNLDGPLTKVSRDEFRRRFIKSLLIHIPISLTLIYLFKLSFELERLDFQLLTSILLLVESIIFGLQQASYPGRVLDIYGDDDLNPWVISFYVFFPITFLPLTFFLLFKKPYDEAKKLPLIFRSLTVTFAILAIPLLIQIPIFAFQLRASNHPSYWIINPGFQYLTHILEDSVWWWNKMGQGPSSDHSNPLVDIVKAYEHRNFNLTSNGAFIASFSQQASSKLKKSKRKKGQYSEEALVLVEQVFFLDKLSSKSKPFILDTNPIIFISPANLFGAVLLNSVEMYMNWKVITIHRKLYSMILQQEQLFLAQGTGDDQIKDRFETIRRNYQNLKFVRLAKIEQNRQIAGFLEEEYKDNNTGLIKLHINKLIESSSP